MRDSTHPIHTEPNDPVAGPDLFHLRRVLARQIAADARGISTHRPQRNTMPRAITSQASRTLCRPKAVQLLNRVARLPLACLGCGREPRHGGRRQPAPCTRTARLCLRKQLMSFDGRLKIDKKHSKDLCLLL